MAFVPWPRGTCSYFCPTWGNLGDLGHVDHFSRKVHGARLSWKAERVCGSQLSQLIVIVKSVHCIFFFRKIQHVLIKDCNVH